MLLHYHNSIKAPDNGCVLWSRQHSLMSSLPGGRGSVWGAGCRQRHCPAVAVPDRSGPRVGWGVVFLSKKKAQKTTEQGLSTKMKWWQSKTTAGSGAPLVGSLLSWLSLLRCLQPVILYLRLIAPQPNEDARTCSQAPPKLLTLRVVSSRSTNTRKRGREKRVLFPILFTLKGWMLHFLINFKKI